ncbi:hypothetical protein MMC26_007018 [Xylographa opegraphella]|nr:hypothetical protein [Xylographa opegraphella]
MAGEESEPGPRRLILCFDGTGNTFAGNTGDTNIVKLYDKFKRDDPNQYHYYQTGIGTYDIGGGSINKSFFGNIKAKISRSADSAFGTTFDAHVIAGYRFLMKYYKAGDKIYMFGFSRGAFTARFLARMIHTVGLLSEGNEEMVPFAYELYQQYEQGKAEASTAEAGHTHEESASSKPGATDSESAPLIAKPTDGKATLVNGKKSSHDEGQCTRNKIYAFRDTFCRQERKGDKLVSIKAYFLGIFDCVSSVSVLESPFGKAPSPVSVMGTAEHVRHAVAVDEHRVKFKAALLDQDYQNPATKKNDEDIKEVWFPGNHGDVGGGWPAPMPESKEKVTWGQAIRKIFFKDVDTTATVSRTDPYQMSDIPLAWMIRELEEIGAQDESAAIQWSARRDGFKDNFYAKGINDKQSLEASMHDTLKIGGGSSLFKVMIWNLMECLPLIPRWELEMSTVTKKLEWVYSRWTPNLRSARDVPKGAVFHQSLLLRLKDGKMKYRPYNNHGGSLPPCLVADVDFVVKERDNGGVFDNEQPDVHTTYTLGHVKTVQD